MKRILILLFFLFTFGVLRAQGQSTQIVSGPVDPPHCDPTKGQLFFNNSTSPGVTKYCSAVDTWSPLGGGGGGGIVNGTVPHVAIFTAANAVGDGTCTDDGVNPFRCPNGNNTAVAGLWIERVADTGGSTAGLLMCRSSVSLTAICPAGTTRNVIGVAGNTVVAGQVVRICAFGSCRPKSSNTTTTGDWLIPSASVAGNVDDTGSTTKPANIQSFLAESSVAPGANVLTTLLMMDTIDGAGGLGSINPCTINGLTYYIAGTTLSCLSPPVTNGNYLVNYNVTASASVPPTATLPGVPVNAQTGTTYTKLYSDRVSLDTFSNASPIAVTLPQANSAGFTLSYVDANLNLGAGLATITPSTSTINGAASQILPSKWFGLLYSDNTNYFMPVLPSLLAFPNCTDTGGNHLNINTATGAFSCGTTSGGSLTIGGTSCTVGGSCSPSTTVGGQACTLGASCNVHHGISFTIGDPAGSVLTAAATTTDYISVPFACTIARYTLMIDAGTITVKFWKVALGTAIPTVSNSISTSGVSISSGTAITSTTLSDFTTTAVAANDAIAMNVTAVSGAHYINGVLSCSE